MNIHERLKYLRSQLGLTTRAFGASINMTGGAITNMEKGLRNITDRTLKDICREDNVNPEWLTEGKEPVFLDTVSSLDVDEDVKQLANDNDRELVKSIIHSLYEKIEPQKTADKKTKS